MFFCCDNSTPGSWCNAPNSDKYDWNSASTIFCCDSYHCKCLSIFNFQFGVFCWVEMNELEVGLWSVYDVCSFALFQVAENLAQLMYSVLMTGYMFRNAQYRLELQQSLEQVALPEPQEKKVSSFCSLSPQSAFFFVLGRIFVWKRRTEIGEKKWLVLQ